MSVVLINENCDSDYDYLDVWMEYPEVDVSHTEYVCSD
jgi:hypothetical protein